MDDLFEIFVRNPSIVIHKRWDRVGTELYTRPVKYVCAFGFTWRPEVLNAGVERQNIPATNFWWRWTTGECDSSKDPKNRKPTGKHSDSQFAVQKKVFTNDIFYDLPPPALGTLHITRHTHVEICKCWSGKYPLSGSFPNKILGSVAPLVKKYEFSKNTVLIFRHVVPYTG